MNRLEDALAERKQKLGYPARLPTFLSTSFAGSGAWACFSWSCSSITWASSLRRALSPWSRRSFTFWSLIIENGLLMTCTTRWAVF